MTNESPPFITALKTGGTKEEAIFALERMWEDSISLKRSHNRAMSKISELQKDNRELRKILQLCLADYSNPNFTGRYGMADRIRAVLK